MPDENTENPQARIEFLEGQVDTLTHENEELRRDLEQAKIDVRTDVAKTIAAGMFANPESYDGRNQADDVVCDAKFAADLLLEYLEEN